MGILTERGVLRAVAGGIAEDRVVADWMTRDPETMEPDEPIRQAAVLIIHGFRHLPIVEGDHVGGMLSIRDLMRVVPEDASPRRRLARRPRDRILSPRVSRNRRRRRARHDVRREAGRQ